MLIGIDASRAVSDAPTGTETYSRELIRALLARDDAHSYRLYTRARVPREYFGVQSNFDVRAIPFPRLWSHLRLSFEMLTHPPEALWVPAHVLPLIHPRRSVVTVHDLGQLHFPDAYPARQRFYHNWSARWNAHSAAHLFADSEATRDDLIQFYRVAPAKITVVYPAYDAKLYQPARDAACLAELKSRFRIGGDYVLAVGTIHPRKNYARLIEAFERLTSRDLQLIIVGKRGWLYASIFEQVKRLGLESRVSFLDYVPATDLPALFSGARAFAFPSLHEGFGLPVLEAQACGTPVVCSMTSSFPEVAGDAALFVDPFDVDALAGALDRALTDDTLRTKLIEHGFENVKRFSWDESARRVLSVFAKM